MLAHGVRRTRYGRNRPVTWRVKTRKASKKYRCRDGWGNRSSGNEAYQRPWESRVIACDPHGRYRKGGVRMVSRF